MQWFRDYLYPKTFNILSKLRFSPVAEAVSIADAKRRQLEKQIAALESKMRKEKQLNRRMEINAELKRLRKEISVIS